MQLLSAARFVRLDRHEGACLPDLALLAMLQHHGAATPLLDVSLDPIVALYMAVVSTDQADDESDGTLFAIKKPIDSIRDFTSSSFAAVYEDLDADKPSFYSAPDVSERLRIQRGHFLVAKVKQSPGFTVPLGYQKASKQADAWIYKLLEARGQQGAPPLPTTEVVIFRINKRFKRKLKIWLEDRSGLTVDFVYPTPWHRPHLDAFCAAHGRSAKWTNIELPKDPAF